MKNKRWSRDTCNFRMGVNVSKEGLHLHSVGNEFHITNQSKKDVIVRFCAIGMSPGDYYEEKKISAGKTESWEFPAHIPWLHYPSNEVYWREVD